MLMEADFSIRNEVESIKPSDDRTPPPQVDKSSYDDLFKKLNNAPPFPSSPIYNQPINPLLEYQHQMLMEHQSFDRLITLKILDQQNAWKWCSFILLGILILCFVKMKN